MKTHAPYNNTYKRRHNYGLTILRFIFGATFIFSGYVKAIDPLGTNYKIVDYLEAMHLTGFNNLALIASIILCCVELCIGINLLLGLRLKETTWLALLFMLVMTPLTLWIAIADPVSDCGCFGDALVIGNWTTLIKNIVLSILIFVIYKLQKNYHEWLTKKVAYLLSGVIFMITCALSCNSLNHLPIIDFRPYHIGANIAEGMQLKEGQMPDQYEVTFVYEKEGEERTFDMDNIPYNDSTWHFVSQNSELIKKGDVPAIHDFSIYTENGDNLADSVLNVCGKTVIAVMYDLKKTNIELATQMNTLYNEAQRLGYGFIALSASIEEIPNFRKQTNAQYPIYNTDPITLKTMIRANPGILVLDGPVIVDKWNMYDNHNHTLNKK